jgi:hypothetical protein
MDGWSKMVRGILLLSCFGAIQVRSGTVANADPIANPILREIAGIKQGLKRTRYVHRAKIDVKQGRYDWDCSIMVAWILERATPLARRALGKDNPLARDFYRSIAQASTDRPSRGWMRVQGPDAILPGDVFAWLKPNIFKGRNNTGHVGFVLERPRPHPQFKSVRLVRIADSTRELHEDDSRPSGGEGGFGTATIAFLFDDQGAAVAYGWYGEAQDPQTYVPTPIVFGRPNR